MDTTKKTRIAQIAIFAVIIVVIVIAMKVVVSATKSNKQYDSFAQCLTQKGVKFYGAFWCPHCQAQKREFGSSVKYLPYIECSNPDGKGQDQTCNDAKITGYPTWEFPDGSRVSGEQTLQSLADKTGCALASTPDQTTPAVTPGAASSVQ